MGRGGESGILRNLKAQMCAPRGDDARGREGSTQAEQSKGQKDKRNNKGVNPDQSPFFCRRTKSSLRRLFPSVSPVGMEAAKEEGGVLSGRGRVAVVAVHIAVDVNGFGSRAPRASSSFITGAR